MSYTVIRFRSIFVFLLGITAVSSVAEAQFRLKNVNGTVLDSVLYPIDSIQYLRNQTQGTLFSIYYKNGTVVYVHLSNNAVLGQTISFSGGGYPSGSFTSTDLADGKGGVGCSISFTGGKIVSFSYARTMPHVKLAMAADSLMATTRNYSDYTLAHSILYHLWIGGSIDDTDNQSSNTFFMRRFEILDSKGSRVRLDSTIWPFPFGTHNIDTVIGFPPVLKTQGRYLTKLSFVADTMLFVPDTGITFHLIVNLAAYQSACNGLPWLNFDASYANVDDNVQYPAQTGTGWKDGAGIGMIQDSGTVFINNILRFHGIMAIDTINSLVRSANGEFYIYTILPFGKPGPFKLGTGFWPPFTFSCNGLVAIAQNILSSDSLGGFGFKIDSIYFFTDSTGVNGVRLGATVKMPFTLVPGACDTITKQSKLTVSIAPIEITNLGIGGAIHVSNVGIYPGFCVKDLFGAYYKTPDSLSFGADIKAPFVDKLALSAGWKQGVWNAVSFNVQQKSGGIPIGETTMLLSGVRGSASGWKIPPLKCSMGGTFDDVVPKSMEWLGDISYEEPSTLKGSLTLKILDAPLLGWQMVGNVTTTIDWQHSVSFKGTEMDGTLGNGYAINGTRSLTFTWNPSFSIIGQGNGSLSMPKIGGLNGNAIADWINSFLPIQFAGVESYARVAGLSGSIKANVTFPIIGSAHIVMGLNPTEFNLGFGTVPLNIMRGPGKEIPNSLPMDSITIPPNLAFAVIRIRSNGVPSASTLIDPSGATHVAGAADTTIGYRIDTSTEHGFWAMRNPNPGTWVLSMPARTSTDTVDAQGEPIEEPLHFSATQTGKRITVVWTPLSTGDTAALDVFLDDSNGTFTGFRVASAEDKTGSLSFDLSDSLPGCSYYLYAARDNGVYVSQSYSPDPLDNSKTAVPTPAGVKARYGSNDTVFLRWDSVATPGLSGYVIRVSDGHGNDSTYGSVGQDQDSAAIVVANAAGKWITVLAFMDGIQSCWSNSVSASSGVSYPEKGALQDNLGLQFWPNPGRNKGEVSFTIDSREMVMISIFNVLGQKLMTPVAGTFDPGTHSIGVDLSTLTPGAYYCRIQAGTSVQTIPLSIEP